AVNYRHIQAVEVGEVLERVENGGAPPALPGRGTQPVEQERRTAVPRGRGRRVEAVGRRVDPEVGQASVLQLREEGVEPVGMLVIDGDGPQATHGTFLRPAAGRPQNGKPASGLAVSGSESFRSRSVQWFRLGTLPPRSGRGQHITPSRSRSRKPEFMTALYPDPK